MAVEYKRDLFCFICTNYITSSKFKITSTVKELIKECYDMKQLNGLDDENQFARSSNDSSCRLRLQRFKRV